MRTTAVIFVLGLSLRLVIAVWAGSHFPPTGDGVFYDTFAQRLAHGAGYTWLWDDGTVTHAAHYPVGYPALLALPYAIFGAKPVVAGIVNAIVGALAVVATHRLAIVWGDRRAIVAASIVAIHPALVLYTPAVMTEGITTALVVSAAAIAGSTLSNAWIRLVIAGVVLGAATLVRPQSLLLAPLLGACAMNGRRMIGAVIVTGLAIAICLPWTARNCEKMNRCALVSVNAGWNLLIGTQTESGSWQAIDVPPECRTVWDEAEKDACFERAARRAIREHPIAWVKRAPAKVRTTLDYFGAGPWYLHASNAKEFGDSAKTISGAIETFVSRAILIAALLHWVRRARGDPSRIACFAGLLLALTDHGYIAYILLALVVLRARTRAMPESFSALAILATALVHAVFFGAGRYGLTVIPFTVLLACSLDAHRAGRRANSHDRVAADLT